MGEQNRLVNVVILAWDPNLPIFRSLIWVSDIVIGLGMGLSWIININWDQTMAP